MKIEQVKFMLWAQDMDRAVAFWRDGIGLKVRMTSPHWSELTHGDAVVALHGGGDGSYNQTGLGFQVADIDSAVEEARAAGATVRMEPTAREGEPIKLAELVDPEGNGFSMSQYVG
jgi:predicted enzyme related to lactoylglutathione lyase